MIIEYCPQERPNSTFYRLGERFCKLNRVWTNSFEEAFNKYYTTILLKRRTDADVECTEDGRIGRIGATKYAGGNGTRKRGGKAERITQG